MKYYIDYFDRGVVSGDLISACGDRATIRVDGRLSRENMHQIAHENNGYHRPVYAGYQIIAGNSLLSASPITPIILLGG